MGQQVNKELDAEGVLIIILFFICFFGAGKLIFYINSLYEKKRKKINEMLKKSCDFQEVKEGTYKYKIIHGVIKRNANVPADFLLEDCAALEDMSMFFGWNRFIGSGRNSSIVYFLILARKITEDSSGVDFNFEILSRKIPKFLVKFLGGSKKIETTLSVFENFFITSSQSLTEKQILNIFNAHFWNDLKEQKLSGNWRFTFRENTIFATINDKFVKEQDVVKISACFRRYSVLNRFNSSVA